MTDEQRNELMDLAERSEDVYQLRRLVRIASDCSVGYQRLFECQMAAVKQANDFMAQVLDLQARKAESDE